MRAQSFLPMLDVLFLCLGALIAAMTQMERVVSIPVELARVGTGAAAVSRGDFRVLSVTAEGATLDGVAIERDDIGASVAGEQVLVRAARDLPTEETLRLLADLSRNGCDIRLQVEETQHPAPLPGAGARSR